jgi:hypothetical protein
MNVTLIQCPLWGTATPPVGLAQLSGCLKSFGHSVSVLDLNIKLYLKRTSEYQFIWAWEQSDFWYSRELVEKYFQENISLIEGLLDEACAAGAGGRIVGFSVNLASMYMSLCCARLLKKKIKDLTIVFGGPVFTDRKFVEDILQDDSVDAVIFGEERF